MSGSYTATATTSLWIGCKKVVDSGIDSIVYEYMLKKDSPYAKQTRVIKRSPPYGMPPVVVTKDMDTGIREKMRNALLNMHKTEKGKAILNAMMIDGFVHIPDEA